MVQENGHHDVGGDLSLTDQIPSDHPLKIWELRVHSLWNILANSGLVNVDEFRRAIEGMPAAQYAKLTYYEKWSTALAEILLERGALTRQEVDNASGTTVTDSADIRFKAGDVVRVKSETAPIRLKKPHLRTPGYIFGRVGTVERECIGVARNPEQMAFGEEPTKVALYRVRFAAADIWEGYGDSPDTVDIEIYQPWLDSADSEALEAQRASRHMLGQPQQGQHHKHDHEHEHGHDHGHQHEERAAVEQAAVDREGDDSAQRAFPEALVQTAVDREGDASAQRALSQAQLCLDKGLATEEALRKGVETLESKAAMNLGAKLTALAWTDPAFKEAYLADAGQALRSQGMVSQNYGTPPDNTASGVLQIEGTVLVALESTPSVHNIIVCTLCSCYPTAVLGTAPSWYKSRAYRARAVREPRAVLAEFGTKLPPDVAVRVHDSTADCRYIVLPARPAGTEGWSREQLEAIVTRDSLVGVTVPRVPAA